MTLAPRPFIPGGAPLTLPLFHYLSPTSWTLVAHGAPGDDSLRRARLDSGADLSVAQCASFGGAQLLKSAMQAGGNLDGAWGGRAGPVHTDDLTPSEERVSIAARGCPARSALPPAALSC